MNRRLAATLATVPLALVLSSCNGDPAPEPPPTETTTAVGTPEPTEPTAEPTSGLTDRSVLVLGFTMDSEPIATAKGSWGSHGGVAVTLTIYAVEASETTTRPVFNLIRDDGQLIFPLESTNWELFPTLVDTEANQAYIVNTYRQPNRRNAVGAYTELNGQQQIFAPGSAQFPPLPAELSTVDMALSGFETVTGVPVTRP